MLLLVADGNILNTATGNQTVMGIGSQFLQSDITANHIFYQHNGGSGASDGFAFDVTDGGIPVGVPLPLAPIAAATSALVVFNIQIDQSPPVITLTPAGDLAVTENDPLFPVRFADTSSVSDGNFNALVGYTNGSLVVDFSSGGTVSDVLAISPGGPITLAGSIISFCPNVIGNVSGCPVPVCQLMRSRLFA